MFSSVTFSVLFAILPIVLAQDSGSDYVQGLIERLNGLGHTEAANLLTRVNSSGTAPWLSQLQNGTYTVFVPDNAALSNLPSNVSSNDTLLSDYLSYHFVHGNFRNNSVPAIIPGGPVPSQSSSSSESASSTASGGSLAAFPSAGALHALPWYRRQDNGTGSGPSAPGLLSGVYPNATIGRSLLNSSEFVQLEGNKSQVLAWSRLGTDGDITLLNQNDITVFNGSTYENLFLNTINGVILPPGNLTTALNATNATSFLNFTEQVFENSSNGTNVTALEYLNNTHGFTLFVPDNTAFETAQLSEFQSNETALMALLGNHILNGTTQYSPDFENATASGFPANFTTAAGETLSVSSNTSGLFLQNQNGSSAQITRPNVLLSNGVFHIINNVLVETDSNPAQASDAFQSASASADVSSTDTLPIGGGFATTSFGGASVASTPTTSSGTETSSSSGTETSSSSGTETSSTGTETSSSATETSTSASSTPTLVRMRRANSSPKVVDSPLAVTVLGAALWVFTL